MYCVYLFGIEFVGECFFIVVIYGDFGDCVCIVIVVGRCVDLDGDGDVVLVGCVVEVGVWVGVWIWI